MSLNFMDVNDAVSEMAVLKFFPSDPGARLAIVRIVGEMAKDMEQVRWLVRRMTSGLYNEWPGPGELRGCFCSKFKPSDGIERHSDIYPDGIPSERSTAPQLAGPTMKQLGEPEFYDVTDPESQETVTRLVEKARKMPAGPAPVLHVPPVGDDGRFATDGTENGDARFTKTLKGIATAPHERQMPPVTTNRDFQPITQADIDRAVAEWREKKAREVANAHT